MSEVLLTSMLISGHTYDIVNADQSGSSESHQTRREPDIGLKAYCAPATIVERTNRVYERTTSDADGA